MTWIITTDMDGTLLNHDDYRWHAAKPCLDILESLDIPVVLNTSKTYAEVKTWVSELGINHPFIVENGSAIYCPEDYFTAEDFQSCQVAVSVKDGLAAIELGVSITELLEFKSHVAPQLESLVECSLDRAIEMTGLSDKEASDAQKRAYTLPIYLDPTVDVNELIQATENTAMQVVKGGRFAHLMGQCDKAKAIQIFQSLMTSKTKSKQKVIALGDSGNDRAMLEHADQAIIIKNHNNNWLAIHSETAIQTSQQAPEGWVEGIKKVLEDEYPEFKELT